MAFDLKITGGTIVDGTGKPGYAGDVGIRDGKVVALGKAEGDATTTIDATGRVVVPRCDDALGHPRVLPRTVWPALLGDATGLRGDRGAQALLDWSSAEQVVVDDLGVLRDADTPEDVLRHSA